MTSRRTDPTRARGAYASGHRVLRDWLADLPDDVWPVPSVLPGWTVGELASHLSTVASCAASLQPAPPAVAALSPLEYMSAYSAASGDIAAAARSVAGGLGTVSASAIVAVLDERYAEAERVLDEFGSGDPVVTAPRGPIRLADYLAALVIEMTLHADDLARSVPGPAPPELPREVVRLAVRTTLDALAERAPGRSVEVRVPPHAAIQCVAGPRHSRGTPPNVIEMGAKIWLRLAGGRTTWAAAVATAQVSASGARADLTPYLPIL